MSNDPIVVDNTPNVVIKNPNVRLVASIVLFVISLLAAIAALFFMWFPEVATTDIPMRAIGFANALVSLLSSVFGLSVLVPNIPRKV